MPDNEVKSERFDVPESPVRNVYTITNFLGCDFTSSPSAVDVNHSSNCVNMIRYMPGKIRKRTGYYEVVKGVGKVYAIWKWDNNNYLIHVGEHIYRIGRGLNGELDFSVIEGETSTVSSILNDPNGNPKVIGNHKYAYIRSGGEALIFGSGDLFFYDGGNTIYTNSEYDIYVPTVTISKKPEGGGTSYEPFNLLTSQFKESFYVDQDSATETVFNLSYDELDSIDKVSVMDSNGEWQDISSYTADLVNGTVTFNTAPGQSPSEGEDNVIIQASKTFSGYYERIANCSFAIAYGVGGSYDRVFISGNPDYPNFDWYSESEDITYFPDLGYSTIGSDASPITGYAIISNNLVTLKGDGTDRQAAVIRSGTFDDNGNALFKVDKSLQGSPILSAESSVMAGIEPLFLTQEGIMAITSEDISGEKLMNSRSYFLNGKLLKEEHLEKSFAVRHGDYYMLFVNSHVYILDTLQIISSNGAPYSTRQYATFYWDNIPATCAASIDSKLFFGTADGQIMCFHTDITNLTSYNDDGATIYCCYDTADIDALLFFKVKTYRFFALRVFPSVASSVKIYALKKGVWELLKYDYATIRYFSFMYLQFSKMAFNTDRGLRLVVSKIRIKKQPHVRFRIENDQLNEPLMIDEFGIEYTQSNNFKN